MARATQHQPNQEKRQHRFELVRTFLIRLDNLCCIRHVIQSVIQVASCLAHDGHPQNSGGKIGCRRIASLMVLPF
jgi:hypothetical protein